MFYGMMGKSKRLFWAKALILQFVFKIKLEIIRDKL